MNAAAPFRSILWRDDAVTHAVEATPDFFGDLGLDKIVADVIGWKYAAYDLAPFFHAPLDDADEIARRQDVQRDLERPGATAAVNAFAQRMNGVRAQLEAARKAYYPREQQKWQLAAAADYGRALLEFARELDAQALAASLKEHRDVELALSAYARRRARHVGIYQFLSRSLTPLFQSDSRLLAPLRDTFFAPLGHLPIARRQMLAILAGSKRQWWR